MMHQAVMLSENENGAKAWEWSGLLDNDYVESGLAQQEHEDTYSYWNKYFAPYIKTVRVEKGVYDEENEENSKETTVFLSDGSTASLHAGRCIDINYDINGDKGPNIDGRDKFKFFIATPRTFSEGRISELKSGHSFDVPYLPLRNTRAKALEICKTAPILCSTLLMYDNWEFKSDYPYKL